MPASSTVPANVSRHVTVRPMTPPALHEHIAVDLRRGIVTGRHPPGSALPSEGELMERYGVARGTVRRALSSLAAEGAILSRRGARRVVLGPPRAQSFGQLLSFSAWARSIGQVPSGRVVRLQHRAATELEAVQLAVAAGTSVYHLERVRLLSGAPVMIERTTFIEEVGALLGSLRLEVESIYERLGERGVVFAHARHTLDALAADRVDGRLLGVRVGTPLLRQRRRTTSPEGVALEWSDDRYLGDAVAFVIDNSAAVSSLGRLHAGDGAGDDR